MDAKKDWDTPLSVGPGLDESTHDGGFLSACGLGVIANKVSIMVCVMQDLRVFAQNGGVSTAVRDGIDLLGQPGSFSILKMGTDSDHVEMKGAVCFVIGVIAIIRKVHVSQCVAKVNSNISWQACRSGAGVTVV